MRAKVSTESFLNPECLVQSLGGREGGKKEKEKTKGKENRHRSAYDHLLARNACPCVHADRKGPWFPQALWEPFPVPPSSIDRSQQQDENINDRLSRRPRMSPAFREWGRWRGGAAAERKIPSVPPLGTDSRPRPGNGGAWGLQAAPRPPPPVPALQPRRPRGAAGGGGGQHLSWKAGGSLTWGGVY